ncbi:hypothetical protein BG011_005855 [Mortierella polycephala]|uniref:Major facilitator superfamily (MFS) profile domain-containing protein n=1 Tax=Mortierella polycephala TaxID=41804 RepID=A0A9P6U984_9FUNG|nr:hypothetical protein BG011_005855 [Mortierella polycephala]
MNAALERPSPTRRDTTDTIVQGSLAVTTAGAPDTATLSSPTKEAVVPLAREGGARAWLVVLGSFFIHSFAFAPTEYVFGIFEHHYQNIFPDATASSIAFVGTTGSSVTYLAGFLAGIVADRFGFRITAFIGAIIMTVSLILASFATQLWHLYLTQGILFGIGSSLAYYPAIAAPSHYFSKKRGLATGLAVSGVGAGGLVLAPLTHSLIDKVDIFWTLRILAALCLVMCGGASMFIVEKKEHLDPNGSVSEQRQGIEEKDQEYGSASLETRMETEKTPFFEALKVFKDPRFLSLSLAELAASVGFLIPLYYMQTYSVFINLSADQGALILGLSNGASFAGRILLGLISDYVSNAKVLLFCSWATAFAVLVLWMVSRTFPTMLLMGLMFGFFAGGYVSLVPVAVAESFGTKQMASTIGLMYAAGGLGMLGGAPLAGFLLDVTLPNTSYLPVILTAGVTMLLGALCISCWAYLNRKASRARMEAH